VTLTPTGTRPGERRARASRSEKCATLVLALSRAATAASKEVELFESPDGVRLGGTDLLLVPPLTPLRPASFSLTFGLTRGPDGFFGWPLLEVIGMTEEEKKLVDEPGIEHQTLFNVMREESVRFFLAAGEELPIGGASASTVRLEYSGQLTRKNAFHQVAGALWLAPGLGIVKEQRQVVLKLYPREVYEPETGAFRKASEEVVVFESEATKLLVHPL
jgi:hypothetical protein